MNKKNLITDMVKKSGVEKDLDDSTFRQFERRYRESRKKAKAKASETVRRGPKP